MKLTIKVNQLMAIILSSIMASIPVALAASESIYTTLYFNIAAVDELSVQMLSGASSYGTAETSAAAPGTAMTTNIEFNSSDGTDAWVNAKTVGIAAATQSDGYPILKMDNTGTTNLDLNINTIGNLNACQKLKYLTSWSATPQADAIDLNSTVIQLDSSYTPAEAIVNLYLWGNFSGCTDANDASTILTMNVSTV